MTAVFPSAVLGNGSFSEEDVSPPLRSKHFIAKFKVYGPCLDFALMYTALINNGAHIVLIHPEVVEVLGLERHLLPVPEPINVAITDGKKKAKKLLSHYIKLSVTSTDGYTSDGSLQPCNLGLVKSATYIWMISSFGPTVLNNTSRMYVPFYLICVRLACTSTRRKRNCSNQKYDFWAIKFQPEESKQTVRRSMRFWTGHVRGQLCRSALSLALYATLPLSCPNFPTTRRCWAI